MKKYIVIALAALVAFAACTKVNPEKKADRISFTVANFMPATKAYTSLLDETTSFNCKAYLHADGEETAQDYFGADGEIISANNETDPSEWLPSHEYFWPKSANSYINFLAWYNSSDVTIGNFQVLESVIKYTNIEITGNSNIIIAEKAWYYKQNRTSEENDEETGHEDAFGQNSVTGGVPMLFHHMLAKVSVKAKAAKVQGGSDNKTSWDITISNAKIINVGETAGAANFSFRTPTTTVPQITPIVGVWQSVDHDAEIALTDSGVLTTTAEDLLAEYSVFPQSLNLTSTPAKLEFDLTIVNKYDGVEYGHETIHESIALATLKNKATEEAIKEWAMNTKYTYTIVVDPETETIKFDPAVVAWDVVEAEEIEVPTL